MEPTEGHVYIYISGILSLHNCELVLITNLIGIMYMYIYLNVSSWRRGKASGAVHRPESSKQMAEMPVPVWRPENQVGEDRCATLCNPGRDGFNPFTLVGPLVGRTVPIHTGEGPLLCSVHWHRCKSLREIPTQTHPETVFTRYLGIPDRVKLTHKSNNHTSLPSLIHFPM